VDVTELRARQAPLKERYRAEPEAADTRATATADWRDPGITATVDGWAGPVRTGLHAATGGDGTDACSADLLLQALLGCAGVTLRSVATAMRLDLHNVRLHAEGHWDARGTLGLDRSVPVGIQDVVVTAEVETDADEATLARLAELTERYCVVAQSFKEPPRFVVRRV
jgi:uncharacterized OsmC-like protein